jgi:FkbM family methyltransferase
MITNIITACSKFLFCLRVSANIITLIKLLYNTKKLRWYKESIIVPRNVETVTAYDFKINRKRLRVFLRTYQGDIDIFYEIFWRKIYELPQGKMLQYKVITDIGANIGMAALYFTIHYPLAKVICIEPDEENYAILQKNCTPYPHIKTMQAAIAEKDGWVRMRKALLQYNNSVVPTINEKNAIPAITMQTLFSVFEITDIDLVKIDIEGAEEAIFAAGNTWLKNINHLVIEIHAPSIKDTCFTRLQEYGFFITSLNSNEFSESVFFAVKNKVLES